MIFPDRLPRCMSPRLPLQVAVKGLCVFRMSKARCGSRA